MEPIYHTQFDSPVGPLLLRATIRGLCGLFMTDHEHSPKPDPMSVSDAGPFKDVIVQLGQYFAGQRKTFDLPLDFRIGTDFQRGVWEELMKIPYGQTMTYGELARRIGNRKAVRAVGLANGRNPVSIIVPCHRVIGASGALTGYGGGVERKRFLLVLERAL